MNWFLMMYCLFSDRRKKLLLDVQMHHKKERKKKQRSRNGIKHVLRMSYLTSIRNWITSNWPRQRFLILKYQRSCYIGIDLISTDPGKSSSYIGCHKERSRNRTGRWCIGRDIRHKHKADRFLQSQKESEYPQRIRQGRLRHHPPSPVVDAFFGKKYQRKKKQAVSTTE